MNNFKRFAGAGLAVMIAASPAAAEQHCGWLENTKTGYWSLADSEGRWAIAQGVTYKARGFNLIGDIYLSEYAPLNRYFGAACACMDVSVNDITGQITRVVSYKAMPMSFCKADKTLPQLQNGTVARNPP